MVATFPATRPVHIDRLERVCLRIANYMGSCVGDRLCDVSEAEGAMIAIIGTEPAVNPTGTITRGSTDLIWVWPASKIAETTGYITVVSEVHETTAPTPRETRAAQLKTWTRLAIEEQVKLLRKRRLKRVGTVFSLRHKARVCATDQAWRVWSATGEVAS